MSKERLEEIDKFKSFIDSLDDSADADDFHKFIDTCQINYEEGTFNEILRFMKSQAERVQELERANKQLKGNLRVYKGYYKNTLKHNKELIEQNKRYREAIDYVMKTESGHYSNMYELLDDLKFTINKILEGEE